jgi:NAD(P)-dependent dehydrogenase (short-subunit alcohol dehydrogenase family)
MTETAQLGDHVASAPLAGRRALVTGGSRGIGAGIVRRLAADGAAVAFTYREAEDPANDLEQEIVGSGGAAWAVKADSADPEALRAAIADTVGRFGGLEVLVNNAGTSHHAPTEEFPMAEYDRLLAVNVRAIFVAIQAALPHLGAGGRIITIGSVLADRARSAVSASTRSPRPRSLDCRAISPANSGPVASPSTPSSRGRWPPTRIPTPESSPTPCARRRRSATTANPPTSPMPWHSWRGPRQCSSPARPGTSTAAMPSEASTVSPNLRGRLTTHGLSPLHAEYCEWPVATTRSD